MFQLSGDYCRPFIPRQVVDAQKKSLGPNTPGHQRKGPTVKPQVVEKNWKQA